MTILNISNKTKNRFKISHSFSVKLLSYEFSMKEISAELQIDHDPLQELMKKIKEKMKVDGLWGLLSRAYEMRILLVVPSGFEGRS